MTHCIITSAVLFDMDGTLVDSTAVVETMWAAFAVDHGLDPEVLIPASHGRQTIDTMREFLPGAPPDELAAKERDFTAREIQDTDGIVEIPGAADLLDVLADVDAPVAVVTSASRALATARMAAAGVPIPRALVTPEDINRGKPDPEGYVHAAALIGVPIGDCVILEDAEAGIAAAVASGAQVVVVGAHASALTEGLARVPDLRSIGVERLGARLVLAL